MRTAPEGLLCVGLKVDGGQVVGPERMCSTNASLPTGEGSGGKTLLELGARLALSHEEGKPTRPRFLAP
jgi:hypothetical protein